MTFAEQIAKQVEEEVEKRVTAWVRKAKGQNFPELFKQMQEDLNRYENALFLIQEKTGHFPLKSKENEEIEVIAFTALKGKKRQDTRPRKEG